MSEQSVPPVRVDGEGVRLDATFSLSGVDTVEVRYRLDNTGDTALAVFDRGDSHAVLTRRQAAGAVGAPTFEAAGDGDVVLRHVALPAARGTPTGPTLPAVPLARRLEVDGSLEDGFSFQIPTAAPPRRIRWCVGVAPFDASQFRASARAEAAGVWQAGDEAVARQQVLCTPWFVVARGAFEVD